MTHKNIYTPIKELKESKGETTDILISDYIDTLSNLMEASDLEPQAIDYFRSTTKELGLYDKNQNLNMLQLHQYTKGKMQQVLRIYSDVISSSDIFTYRY